MSSELRCEQNQNRKPHFKLKSNLINKFFNEPVDALDLRLDKAEATLSSFRENPLEIKQEEIESAKSNHIEHPLDYSEVQIVPPESDSRLRSCLPTNASSYLENCSIGKKF